MNRRAFFGLLAAPAIIRVATLMPVRALPLVTFEYEDMTPSLDQFLARQEASNAIYRAKISALEDKWLKDLIDYHGAYARERLFTTDAHNWLEA